MWMQFLWPTFSVSRQVLFGHKRFHSKLWLLLETPKYVWTLFFFLLISFIAIYNGISFSKQFRVKKIFFPLSIAVRLATNYEKISRRGTATILGSKHISCIAIDNFSIGMDLI
jgi:hypothetical protein